MPSRRRLPKLAARELAARYRLRQEAETRLVDYLAGIAAALGIPLERVEGFDDVSMELILRDPE